MKLADKGVGVEFTDPANADNRVRIDAANPVSANASQRVSHVVVRVGGHGIDANGNRYFDGLANNPVDGHIPIDVYSGFSLFGVANE
ncbi:hypothetical protein [Rhizobium herbae]|uniref:Uncharacterized protein n=1 Tax=Rhizobium herbae TaxID=508661 RepID=A0ABS4EP80_9HYPH|nr:hypothetical protein [Rhizobium herbae]MBP1859753.1 hypothetical protein [Rhizobium herbae]